MGGREQFGALLGDELLVRCDDVLAGGDGGADEGSGWLFAADNLDDDVNRRVVEDVGDVRGDDARGQLDRAGLRGIAYGGAADDEGRANLAGEVVATLEEGAGYSAADDAEADEADTDFAAR